jgi:CspA family cold shock protein
MDATAKHDAAAAPANGMLTGSVRWFDDGRGFGFLARDDGGEDVFCHYDAILADGCFRSVGEGQKVEFEVLEGPHGLLATNVRRVFDDEGTLVTVLCGDAVQVRAISWGRPNLVKMAERLRAFGEVRDSACLVRLKAPPHELTFFDDGRAIVKGTNDVSLARDLVSGWLGVRLPEPDEDCD